MRFQEFLAAVIQESCEAARKDYTTPEQKHKLEGSLAGLRACLDKSPPQLAQLLERAQRVQAASYRQRAPNNNRHWRIVCFAAEVEWVCNVVSAMLTNQGYPAIVPVTQRGLMMAARITNPNTAVPN